MKPELLSVFLDESRALIADMRRALAEADAGPRTLAELFRCAHTLKGNVKMAQFPELEPIAAPLAETLRSAARRGALEAAQAAAVSEALDACEAALEGRRPAGLAALSARLRRSAAPSEDAGGEGPGVRLLLVEDSDLQAEIIERELARCAGAAFAVERRRLLAEGLERLGQDGVDLVLLDLGLPDSAGLETFTSMAARSPAVPVVILTASDDDALAMEAIHRGAQDYLVKGQADAVLLARVIRYAIERKRIEESLRKARDELERQVAERTSELRKANRELSLFASMAAHELMEPVRKIVSWGDLLRRQEAAGLGERGLKMLADMQAAARRQGELLESLRALTRVTTQGRPLEPVDLNAVLEEVLADLGPLFARAGGRVEAQRLPTVRADRLQMRQLFQNLLSNALKYRKKDRPPVAAVRCRARDAASAEISVEDEGIGFEPRYAERIFEPFQRLHGRGEYEGAGMGLAICARIVARHGGGLSARGEPGKGAVFTVVLPLGGSAP